MPNKVLNTILKLGVQVIGMPSYRIDTAEHTMLS